MDDKLCRGNRDGKGKDMEGLMRAVEQGRFLKP